MTTTLTTTPSIIYIFTFTPISRWTELPDAEVVEDIGKGLHWEIGVKKDHEELLDIIEELPGPGSSLGIVLSLSSPARVEFLYDTQ
jgi:hypothetical protein